MRAPLGYEQLEIEVNGAAAVVAVAGPEDGLPVLFVHGFSNTPRFANRRTMESIARAQFVADHPVRIIAPVLPGFSGTARLPVKPSFAAYGDWLSECLRVLGVDCPAVVVGESMGGGISLQYSADHAKDVAGLILLNSVGAPIPSREADDWALGVAQSAFPRRGHVQQWIYSAVDAAYLIRHPFSAWGSFRMIANADLTDAMETIRVSSVPVAALFGRRDTVIPRVAALSFSRSLGTEPVIIDADHRSFIDGHEAVSLVVGEFVDAITDKREIDRSNFAPQVVEDAEERTLALQVSGTTKNKEPVVLAIHGFGLSSRVFAPLAQEVGKWTQFIAPDLPGYGDSYEPDHVFDVDDHAEELSRLIDREGLTDVVLVGYSLGAQIAVALAVLRPDVVRGSVLISITVDPRARSVPLQLGRVSLDIWGERAKYVLVAAADYMRAGPKTMFVASQYAVRDRVHARLRLLTKPVLVIRGTRDRLVPQDWAEKAADLAPNGWVVNIEGEAHAAYWAKPDIVSNHIHNASRLWVE